MRQEASSFEAVCMYDRSMSGAILRKMFLGLSHSAFTQHPSAVDRLKW